MGPGVALKSVRHLGGLITGTGAGCSAQAATLTALGILRCLLMGLSDAIASGKKTGVLFLAELMRLACVLRPSLGRGWAPICACLQTAVFSEQPTHLLTNPMQAD